jgi:hypothetical protein
VASLQDQLRGAQRAQARLEARFKEAGEAAAEERARADRVAAELEAVRWVVGVVEGVVR